MPESRRCTKCGQVKPLDSFSRAPRGKYGRAARCRQCVAANFQANYVPRPRTKYREPYTGDELKTCTNCGTEKSLREFSLSRKATETQNAVYRSDCKACSAARALQWFHDNHGRALASQRKLRLAKTYGMSVAEYDALLRDQAGVCAICRQPPPAKNSRDKRLVVDHCHQTGANRGLLCQRCNRALGLLGDDPVTLRRAIAYLMKHRRVGTKT